MNPDPLPIVCVNSTDSIEGREGDSYDLYMIEYRGDTGWLLETVDSQQYLACYCELSSLLEELDATRPIHGSWLGPGHVVVRSFSWDSLAECRVRLRREGFFRHVHPAIPEILVPRFDSRDNDEFPPEIVRLIPLSINLSVVEALFHNLAHSQPYFFAVCTPAALKEMVEAAPEAFVAIPNLLVVDQMDEEFVLNAFKARRLVHRCYLPLSLETIRAICLKYL